MIARIRKSPHRLHLRKGFSVCSSAGRFRLFLCKGVSVCSFEGGSICPSARRLLHVFSQGDFRMRLRSPTLFSSLPHSVSFGRKSPPLHLHQWYNFSPSISSFTSLSECIMSPDAIHIPSCPSPFLVVRPFLTVLENFSPLQHHPSSPILKRNILFFN